MFWKLALQQAAQQVGHGHALREGGNLDARPHGGRDVEGQASRVEVALVQRIGIALANPRLGVRIRRWTRADADALSKGDVFTARLTLDITPALRSRIKVSAFTQGVTVAVLLRALLEREFPEQRRENTP